MLLTGAAGCGKSALCRHVLEVQRRATDDGAASRPRVMLLAAQCSAMLSECGVPLHSCKQFLQRWRQPQLAPAAVAQRILAAAGLEAADLEDDVRAALRKLLGEECAGQAAPVASQEAALLLVLRGLAQQQPLLLLIEDAEFLDTASRGPSRAKSCLAVRLLHS